MANEDLLPAELAAASAPLVFLASSEAGKDLLPQLLNVLSKACTAPGAAPLALSVLPEGLYFSPPKHPLHAEQEVSTSSR